MEDNEESEESDFVDFLKIITNLNKFWKQDECTRMIFRWQFGPNPILNRQKPYPIKDFLSKEGTRREI